MPPTPFEQCSPWDRGSNPLAGERLIAIVGEEVLGTFDTIAAATDALLELARPGGDR